MLAYRLRLWAGVGVLSLLGVASLPAQEPQPPLPSKPIPVIPGSSNQKMLPALPDTGSTDSAAKKLTPTPPEALLPPLGPATTYQTEYHAPPAVTAQDSSLLSGLYANGDFLFIKPRRNALDYAIVAPNQQQIPSGSVESLAWDARSAFRAGFGYELPGQSWKFGVNYTYLHATDNDAVNAPAGGTLYATLTRGGTFDQVASASATTSLNFNVVDIEASKRTKMCETLDLDVFGGVRVAWIDQQLSAIYNGGSFGANNALVESPTYFNGAGLTVGGEATWKFCPGYGIYGRAHGSLLSGQFRNFLTESNNNGATSIVNVNESYRQLVPVMEVGIGVVYQSEHVRLTLGYDLSNWFNMTNSLSFPSGTDIGQLQRRTSDLMLEGISAGIEIDF